MAAATKLKPVPKGTYSVKEYAALAGVSRFAINNRISRKRLPEGTTATKIGHYYTLTVCK